MCIHPVVKSLVDEIEAHCVKTGMSRTAFGLKAVNDSGLLPDLMAGRQPSFRTIDRIRTFMSQGDHT